MLIEQPPLILHLLYPDAIWRGDKTQKKVYLTFDDGPIPEITPWVLDLLDRYDIKATFFMVGDNVRKHPEVYQMVVGRGHSIGNHSYNHIKAIDYSAEGYMDNVDKADKQLHSPFYRPPHGLLGYKQYHRLRKKYKLVMWDVVTRDYSRRLNGPEVFGKLKKYVRNGSIITFHDSLRAEENMKYALPRSLDWLINQGYQFGTLDELK